MADDLSRAKDLAYRYLGLRARSRKELTAYLVKKEFAPDIVSEVMAVMESYGYVDDRKFAAMFARHLVGTKGLSRYAVRQELRRKGVTDEDAALAILALDSEEDADTEYEVALRVARNKAAGLAGIPPEKARRRLTDYLRRRGYSFGVVSGVLREVL
ncbi:MAG: regulatory protein RecX [Nitrospirae bacterium]|nr:regulatory protein RecX [Nitrospirota bacterium]MBI5695234.1 regulatory protein RecX [Nitrospirota bacterium]